MARDSLNPASSRAAARDLLFALSEPACDTIYRPDPVLKNRCELPVRPDSLLDRLPILFSHLAIQILCREVEIVQVTIAAIRRNILIRVDHRRVILGVPPSRQQR